MTSTSIDADDPLDEAFDGVEEKAHDSGLLRLGAKQNGGQRGRESERVEGRDRDGEGDGQRELLVENAGGSGKEADRDKDGDEDERGGDNGAGDLGHGDAGGLVRVGGDSLHPLPLPVAFA